VPTATTGSSGEPWPSGTIAATGPKGLREAAFGADPGADVWCHASGGAWQRWFAAVVLGGQGHYAAAAAALAGLLAHHDRVLASLAASTLAAHRRQLGAHRAARPLDALALRLASGATRASHRSEAAGATWATGAADPDAAPDEPDPDSVDRVGARVDALLGLAADEIGVGRPGPARRLLVAAERAATPATARAWRTTVRLGWLTAEAEFAAGHADAAVAPARRALAEATARGAVRHRAKSMLILAAALATAGGPEPAGELLQDVIAVAHRHGLVPLVWPAGLLLDRMAGGDTPDGRESPRDLARTALRLAFGRADAPLRAAAGRSLWVPSDLLRSGDSAERSSAGEIHGKYVVGTCQGLTPRDR